MVGGHPGPRLRRLSRAGAAGGGRPAGGPRRRGDHRRGRRLQRRPRAGGRAARQGPGPVPTESGASRRRSARSTAAWSSQRGSWCTCCTATTWSCPASTPPWSKHSPTRRWSPRCAGSKTSMPTTRRPTSPGPTGKGTGVWTDALDAFAVSNRVRAPGIVVRRAAYERVGGYRTDLPHAADWEMWTRLAAHGPIVFVDQVLACYRRHDTSDTSARVRPGPTSGSGSSRSGWWAATFRRTDGPVPDAEPWRTQSCSPPALLCHWSGQASGPPLAARDARPSAARGCCCVAFRFIRTVPRSSTSYQLRTESM